MISALLVDDEPINISNLQSLLNRHCPTVQVVGTAENADQAAELIMALAPDVVFLDIEMPGKNGFDLLRMFPQPEFEVVFVTAYDAYGIMAVKFSALDYLLKPINTDELKQTVDRLGSAISRRKHSSRLDHLFSVLDRQQPDKDQKIALPTQKETFIVPVRDIVRCESSNNYTTFFMADDKEHLISKPLYEYEEMLSPYGFIRCHQSHLVNKAHVKSVLNEDSGYLIMTGSDKKVPISKQKKA
ncbi:MAG: response regulator transcription factor, partial [Sphingobacteriales bacterium]